MVQDPHFEAGFEYDSKFDATCTATADITMVPAVVTTLSVGYPGILAASLAELKASISLGPSFTFTAPG